MAIDIEKSPAPDILTAERKRAEEALKKCNLTIIHDTILAVVDTCHGRYLAWTRPLSVIMAAVTGRSK